MKFMKMKILLKRGMSGQLQKDERIEAPVDCYRVEGFRP